LLLLVLGCGSAWAADPAVATYNWTGFYAGLNTGAAKNNSGYTIDAIALPASGGFNNPAFTVGGQAGYNYQAGNFVYGLETDLNYNSTDDSGTGIFGAFVAPPPGGPVGGASATYTVNQQIDYFGTLRGRLGFTPADRLLLYVTGGLAYGHVSSSTSFSTPGVSISSSSSAMQVGWAVGTGGEYALTNNWSVKLEYLYIDLGSMSYPVGSAFAVPASTLTTTINTAQNVIRVGLNYKF
jgi:outer membrane immunogenic protein